MFYRSSRILSLALAGAVFFSASALARDLIVVDGPIKAKNVKCRGCVDARDIGVGAVTRNKIQSGAVGAAEIQDGAVGATEIQDGAVTAPKIGTGAVTNPKIGAGAVGTANIQDKSITIEKLADGIEIPTDIAPSSVGTTELQDGAVTEPKLAPGAVTAGKIANDAVSLSNLTQDLRDLIPSFKAVDVFVDCSGGESVQEALAALSPGQPAIITISGTCNEAVSLIRDDVTLQGDGGQNSGGPTSVIDAGRQANNPIAVDGAKRVTIDGLLLRNGAGSGLSAFNGATVEVTNNVMENNGANGMFLGLNATANIDNNQMKNNDTNGIRVMFNGSARITNNRIEDNGRHGLQITDTSSAWIGFGFEGVGGNTITGNTEYGILLFGGAAVELQANTISGNNLDGGGGGLGVYRSTAALIGDNRITSNFYGVIASQSSLILTLNGTEEDRIDNNRQEGILAINGSSLDIREGLIEGNGTDANADTGDINGISVNDNSVMRIRQATIRNNVGSGIVLRRGGGVTFREPDVTITGHFDQAGEFDLDCRGSADAPAGETHYSGGFGSSGALRGIGEISELCVLVHGF